MEEDAGILYWKDGRVDIDIWGSESSLIKYQIDNSEIIQVRWQYSKVRVTVSRDNSNGNIEMLIDYGGPSEMQISS